MYALQNISIIIPTYNRAEDLKITLLKIKPFLNKLREVIIIDQSKNEETKKLINSLNNKKIRYIYSKIPSITIARNLGVKNTHKQTKIISFIDDDVTLDKDYFKNILAVFNNNDSAKAVAGFFVNENLSKRGNFEIILRKLFFLDNPDKNRARIVSAYGNTYPGELDRVINSQWIPGVNMCYKKEVFREQKFDENLLGYTIGEDIDFSHRLYKKYPNSVFITPYARLVHRASSVERTPTEKMAYINQVDHFYFFFKNKSGSFLERVKFSWSLVGITLLRTINLIIKPTKVNYLKEKYFIKSLIYCLNNLKKIKSGKVREFI